MKLCDHKVNNHRGTETRRERAEAISIKESKFTIPAMRIVRQLQATVFAKEITGVRRENREKMAPSVLSVVAFTKNQQIAQLLIKIISLSDIEDYNKSNSFSIFTPCLQCLCGYYC